MKRFLLAPCSGTICSMRLLFPTILLCAAAHAAEVKVASAPTSAHYDTESVTNAPILRPMMERARLLRADMSLWATKTVFLGEVGQ